MRAFSRISGFTLVELVIFTVIVGTAVGAIALQITATVGHSHEPLIREKAIAVANAYMDEILHKRWDENTPTGGGAVVSGPSWQATRVYAAGDRIVPTSPNGHGYEALNGGTSGATEPTWRTDGTNTPDNGINWRDLGTVAATAGDCSPADTGCGPDGAEIRRDFDDVDDYDGLADSPPRDAEGGNMPGYSGFSVTVEIVRTALNGATAQDVKRIDVQVATPTGESISLSTHRLNF